jgi:hypothetical protein
MPPLQDQFKILEGDQPNAKLDRLPDGSHLISIRDFPLPEGWSKKSIELKFLAPVGFPFAPPDCFWTDPDLRIAGGGVPQSTGNNPLPHSTSTHLWFSWHVSTWNPNVDNLLTFLHVIEQRLRSAR